MQLSKQGHTVHRTAIDEKGVADRQRNRFQGANRGLGWKNKALG